MLSFLTYAKISQDMYGNKRNYTDRASNYLEFDKNDNKIYRIFDVDVHTTPSSNFFAALYIKFSQGRAESAVIAFRGTVPGKLGNDYEDIVSWYSSAMGSDKSDRIPGYYDAAQCFTYKTRNYLRKNFPHLNSPQHLRFTGHSLGGALAQLIALQDYNAQCVIFNSPVCRNIVNPKALDNWRLINNVNARYDVISKIGGVPIGNIFVVDIPEMETEAKSLFKHFEQQQFLVAQQESQEAGAANSGLMRIAATTKHVSVLFGSLQGVTNLPREHMMVVECENEAEQTELIQRLNSKLGDNYCDLKVALQTVPQAIMAQHDIGHMVSALSRIKIGGVMI